MIYPIQQARGAMSIDGDWDKPAWRAVPAVELTHFMGERPSHFPQTQARLIYDHDSIYVIFRVHDRYVRAIARKHEDEVWKDSCVEFFFAPSGDGKDGYFNLEVNCGGSMLFHFQPRPWEDMRAVSAADFDAITVAHSLPKIVEPERTEPTTWTVEYRLPFELLHRYCGKVLNPEPGVRWRANFSKCADDCSHPHWLTWAPVDHPQPNFHLPEYFGTIEFT